MDFRIDLENEDFAIVETDDGYDIELVEGANEVMQYLWIRTQIYLGEVWYLAGFGVPYFTDIFQTPALPAAITTVYGRITMNTPGVKELVAVRFDVDSIDRTQNLPIEIEFKTVDNPENLIYPLVFDFTQGKVIA